MKNNQKTLYLSRHIDIKKFNFAVALVGQSDYSYFRKRDGSSADSPRVTWEIYYRPRKHTDISHCRDNVKATHHCVLVMEIVYK